MTIEERIQALRKSKGLSQEQLAEILGVSRQAVSKWESGQSLPEIEKLISMSELFEATIDYILKGESASVPDSSHGAARLGSQIVSAVAAMLLAVGIIAAVGQLSDGASTMDIYGGLVIEAVGVMLILVGWFLAGGRVISRPIYVVNVLLAGVLPSSLISQIILGLTPQSFTPLNPLPLMLFICVYAVICGVALYFPLIRKRR